MDHTTTYLLTQMDAWATEMNVRLQNIFQRMMSEGIENSGAVLLRVTSAKMELLNTQPDGGGHEKGPSINDVMHYKGRGLV